MNIINVYEIIRTKYKLHVSNVEQREWELFILSVEVADFGVLCI